MCPVAITGSGVTEAVDLANVTCQKDGLSVSGSYDNVTLLSYNTTHVAISGSYDSMIINSYPNGKAPSTITLSGSHSIIDLENGVFNLIISGSDNYICVHTPNAAIGNETNSGSDNIVSTTSCPFNGQSFSTTTTIKT